MARFLESIKRRILGRSKQQLQELAALITAIDAPLAAGDLAEAERRCQTLDRFLASLACDDQHEEVRKLRAVGYFDLGGAYRAMRLRSEAEAAYSQAIQMLESLTASRALGRFAASQLAACQNHLGLLYMDCGPPEQAAAALDKAIALRRKLVVQQPDDPENQVYLGGVLCNRAHVAREAGQTDVAIELYDESLAILDAAIAPCDCGSRDAIAAAISQATGRPHWIALAQEFRYNAERGRALALEEPPR